MFALEEIDRHREADVAVGRLRSVIRGHSDRSPVAAVLADSREQALDEVVERRHPVEEILVVRRGDEDEIRRVDLDVDGVAPEAEVIEESRVFDRFVHDSTLQRPHSDGERPRRAARAAAIAAAFVSGLAGTLFEEMPLRFL